MKCLLFHEGWAIIIWHKTKHEKIPSFSQLWHLLNQILTQVLSKFCQFPDIFFKSLKLEILVLAKILVLLICCVVQPKFKSYLNSKIPPLVEQKLCYIYKGCKMWCQIWKTNELTMLCFDKHNSSFGGFGKRNSAFRHFHT